MTALAKERMSSAERWKYKVFTLTSGTKAYKNATAVLVRATGKVKPGVAGAGLVVIGKFAETVDATSADKPVNVELPREIEVEWWANSGTSALSATTDILATCYVEDDQTVSAKPTGNPVAGRVWAVDSAQGVAVERLQSSERGLIVGNALPAFAAGDLVVPDNPRSGTVYELPATAANSTVTLPAACEEGAEVTFVADGTNNGHTVQYRDATGPTNLTTALTASKRHQVRCVFLNSKWRANAYVSP